MDTISIIGNHKARQKLTLSFKTAPARLFQLKSNHQIMSDQRVCNSLSPDITRPIPFVYLQKTLVSKTISSPYRFMLFFVFNRKSEKKLLAITAEVLLQKYFDIKPGHTVLQLRRMIETSTDRIIYL